MSEIKIYTKEELSKAKDTALNARQMDFLLKPTPAQFVRTRPAKGGGEWKYVSGAYVKKVLNLMFGFNWSFEVDKFDVNLAAKQAIVLGRLTCIGSNGSPIVKMQFGRADIKFRQSSDMPLDLGNDLKAATSDALKKCASELGIAMDIYSGEEMRHIEVVETVEEKDTRERDRVIAWLKSDNATPEHVAAFMKKPEFIRFADDAEINELCESKK